MKAVEHPNAPIHIFTTTATNEKLPARRFWARWGRSRDADPVKNIILMHGPPARLYGDRHGLCVSLNIPNISLYRTTRTWHRASYTTEVVVIDLVDRDTQICLKI